MYRSAKKGEYYSTEINEMCQAPPPYGISFCIMKCTQVPPITIDHVDMATVLKLFSSLRTEVKVLSLSNEKLKDNVTKIEENLHRNASYTASGLNKSTVQKRKTKDEVIAEQSKLLQYYREKSVKQQEQISGNGKPSSHVHQESEYQQKESLENTSTTEETQDSEIDEEQTLKPSLDVNEWEL